MTKNKKALQIVFTIKELEFLQALAGSAMLDKSVLDSFEIDFSERLALNNKIAFLIYLKNLTIPQSGIKK